MQITAMSLIKDEERLELLKEIGGTKVYEERRRDSLKVMHETEGRRTHIEEVVSRIHIACARVLSVHSSCHGQRQLHPAGQHLSDCVTLAQVFTMLWWHDETWTSITLPDTIRSRSWGRSWQSWRRTVRT